MAVRRTTKREVEAILRKGDQNFEVVLALNPGAVGALVGWTNLQWIGSHFMFSAGSHEWANRMIRCASRLQTEGDKMEADIDAAIIFFHGLLFAYMSFFGPAATIQNGHLLANREGPSIVKEPTARKSLGNSLRGSITEYLTQ